MANILDKYGIKEVADVTFYAIDKDGNKGAPVLFLDTLKVSTIEQTAEQAEARGGKGNPPLIIWDYGKEINVTLEDALFSAKSLAIMFGDGKLTKNTAGMEKTWEVVGTETAPSEITVGDSKLAVTGTKYYDETGIEATNRETGKRYYATGTIAGLTGQEIAITPVSFPGNYYVVGDTFARSQVTGKDEYFQFIIPNAKVNSENTITLEAEGDPSVFNMSLRVLRNVDGEMMKLVKYGIEAQG